MFLSWKQKKLKIQKQLTFMLKDRYFVNPCPKIFDMVIYIQMIIMCPHSGLVNKIILSIYNIHLIYI